MRGLEVEEAGGGVEEEPAWGVGGDEAAGRVGVWKEKREAEEGTEGGTADSLVVGAAAGGGGELGEAPVANA